MLQKKKKKNTRTKREEKEKKVRKENGSVSGLNIETKNDMMVRKTKENRYLVGI